jgi:4-amino-4-deoxy-L-arabinose transferase-like glycosyltransferase
MSARTPHARNAIAVGLLAFLARLVYFLIVRHHHGALVVGDSPDFIRLARALGQGHGYAVPGVTVGGFPLDLNRPPGYPLLLVAANLGGHISPQRSALVQVVLGAVFAGGVTYVVSRWLGALTGVAAGVMLAIDFSTILNTPLILSDELYAMLFAIGIALVARALVTRGWRVAVAGGLVLGAAALTKPIGLFAVPVVLIAILAAPRRTWRIGLACLVAFAVVTVPWAVRNHSEHGVFTLSTISSVNLYVYTVPPLTHGGWLYSTGAPSGATSPANAAVRRIEDGRHLSTAQLSAAMSSGARRAIIHHFPKFVVQELYGALHVMFGTGKETLVTSTGDAALPSLITSWLPLAQILVMWALAAWGVIAGWRDRRIDRSVLVLLVAGIALMVLAAGGPVGYGRYRLPATPPECALAAIGLAALVRRRRAPAVWPTSAAGATPERALA